MIVSNTFKFSFKYNSIELYFFIGGSREYYYFMRKNDLVDKIENKSLYYTHLNKFDRQNYRNIFPDLSSIITLNLIINENYFISETLNDSFIYDNEQKVEIDKIVDSVLINNIFSFDNTLNFKLEFINNNEEFIINIENGKLINKKCLNVTLNDIINIIYNLYKIFNKKYTDELFENKLIYNINFLLLNPLENNHELYTKTMSMYNKYIRHIYSLFNFKNITDNINKLKYKYKSFDKI